MPINCLPKYDFIACCLSIIKNKQRDVINGAPKCLANNGLLKYTECIITTTKLNKPIKTNVCPSVDTLCHPLYP